MLIGYNTNVTYKGKVYHVQTEDSGLSNPFIVTLLYHQGAILHSIKTGYAHLIGHPSFKEELRELMKKQHKEMIKALIAGKGEAKQAAGEAEVPRQPVEEENTPASPDASSNVRSKSLDDILLEHISRKVKKA